MTKPTTNSKYQLDQFDFAPQDDEGEINNFQIYQSDILSKQIADKQIMPREGCDSAAHQLKRDNAQRLTIKSGKISNNLGRLSTGN